jgi:hypothetical protein
MAGTIVADTIQADSTSTLVLKNGVANTPPTIQDSAGTQIGTFCRAWVNFNGTTNTGGFCTIRSSFNVTSVADNGTGDYTVNFTTAMPDANYAVSGTASPVLPGAGNGYRWVVIGSGLNSDFSMLTTSVRIQVIFDASSKADGTTVTAAVFR